jgi:hypothetical protein
MAAITHGRHSGIRAHPSPRSDSRSGSAGRARLAPPFTGSRDRRQPTIAAPLNEQRIILDAGLLGFRNRHQLGGRIKDPTRPGSMRRSLLPPRIRAAGSAESERLQELANYRQLPLEHGPLVMGACGGGGSGAGIRFSMAGACGAGAPNRVVGLRPKSPRPDPWPTPAPGIKLPRAKPGVDPRRQATNTDAKTRFMIAFLLLTLRACGI